MTNTWKVVLALVGLTVAWWVSGFGWGFSTVTLLMLLVVPLAVLWLTVRTIRNAWTGK